MIVVQEADFDAGALQAVLRERCTGAAGALVTFTGYVRDFSSEDATRTLTLEHYPGMCERELEDIANQACERWRVLDYVIVHRVGTLARNDQIVFVATASAHRGDAFQACEYIMDALKTRAPFWKRETLASGRSFWVEQKQSDTDRACSWDGHPSKEAS
ncbi:molybdenum cofactor biosynthesis protein MoaE [Achromobacter aloeverae]|uniref:Molybdopterin synthase catalytic subunit n=1 Tax=Achromobacter aloeverae TaxID=1750518 RepID=A0A4Q1HDU0_9BURK|nr:molybdenum cofactor biosynthesis protein MoaE [Achromobacter aloeverae]RXN84392.1 molybdenum cofactor biosynthesis protein MoaE [Achromobacter aloeverae]